LESHMGLVESLPDKSRLGMFYGWLGCAKWHRELFQEAYQHLSTALQLGEETGDQQVIGYACTWLAWTSVELGRLDEAADFAGKAQQIAAALAVPDQYMYFNSLAGLGHVHWHKGERQKTFEAGHGLLEFGQNHLNIRSLVMGHTFLGFGHLLAGDVAASMSCFQEAMEVSADPWYAQFPRLALCYAQVMSGQIDHLEEALNEILQFSQEHGAEYVGSPAQFFLGAVLLAKGQMRRGMNMLGAVQRRWFESGSKLRYAQSQYIMGRIYAHIASGDKSKGFSTIAKNLGFLLKEVPFARHKAVECFNTAIQIADEIGAKVMLGKCYLCLGQLHGARGKSDQARKCLSKAVDLFQECEVPLHRQEAVESLESLGSVVN
jgi:tetratricopeptide (TPR) repeat protein